MQNVLDVMIGRAQDNNPKIAIFQGNFPFAR